VEASDARDRPVLRLATVRGGGVGSTLDGGPLARPVTLGNGPRALRLCMLPSRQVKSAVAERWTRAGRQGELLRGVTTH